MPVANHPKAESLALLLCEQPLDARLALCQVGRACVGRTDPAHDVAVAVDVVQRPEVGERERPEQETLRLDGLGIEGGDPLDDPGWPEPETRYPHRPWPRSPQTPRPSSRRSRPRIAS